MYKITFLSIALFTLSGCASIFEGPRQNVTIATLNDNYQDQTRCKMINEEGSWVSSPNVPVSIHKDGNNLDINCENSLQIGEAHVEPEFEGAYLAIDLLLYLCIISCIIDGANNSFYEYPQFIPVQMNDKKLSK